MAQTIDSMIPDLQTWGVETRGALLNIDAPLVPHKEDPWVVDAEWNKDGSCAGIGITNDGHSIFFYSRIVDPHFFENVQLVGHNIKDDVQMLRKWGFHVSTDQIVWDTMVGEYVKDSTTNEYGLKDLAGRKYGAKWPTYKEMCGVGKKAVDIGALPVELRANYNGCDVFYTYKLYADHLKDVTETERRYMEEIELPTLRVLTEMEERGVRIDAKYLRQLDVQFGTEISGVATAIRSMAGQEINLNSHQQIKRLLAEHSSLRLSTTAHEELVKHEQIPLVAKILRYRALTKLKGTYVAPLIERSGGQDTFILHARFNQCVTQTGRLSSSDPNLQNIPTRTAEGDAIRQGFVASDGMTFADADYSQIEPRLMAHFSGDQALIDIFETGQDLYDGVAQILGLCKCKEHRKLAKVLWLAMSYNAGAYKISKTAGITQDAAEEFLDRMREGVETFFYWKDKVIATAQLDGYVETLFGRRIPLSQEWSHLAPNYKVQGSAAEINKLGLIATREFEPCLSVHDEGLYNVTQPEIKDEIKRRMENVVQLRVPLIVEAKTGPTWREAKP